MKWWDDFRKTRREARTKQAREKEAADKAWAEAREIWRCSCGPLPSEFGIHIHGCEFITNAPTYVVERIKELVK